MQVKQLQQYVLDALNELKAQDVVSLDVKGKTDVTDMMIIATGTSNRHVKSCIDKVIEDVKKAGVMPLSVEGKDKSDWVLVDLGDVVVHVMLAEAREFYALESLWNVS